MKINKYFFSFLLILFFSQPLWANRILLPMDETQKNHLKAYGISYWVLSKNVNVDWMLNYRGGSFAFLFNEIFEKECIIRGVSYNVVSESEYAQILAEINRNDVNQEVL